MLNGIQNIEISFFDAISEVEPFLLQNKTEEEIFLAGLEAYRKIEGCNSAALYLMSPDDFDFKLYSCTPEEDREKFAKWFRQLIESGGIAQSLSKSEITIWDLEDEPSSKHFLIIPLLIQTGILGLVIITLKETIKANDDSLGLIKLYSNYYAILMHNIKLIKDAKNVKENEEQRISAKTNDIVQSTRELKSILDSVQAGIIMIDKTTTEIADANNAALELSGYGKEEIIGLQREALFISKAANKFFTNQEAFLKRKDGTISPIIKTTAEIQLGGDTFFIITFLDITERKKMEEALQEAHYKLEQRVEERTIQLSLTNEELQNQITKRIKAEEEKIKLYWAVQQSPVSIIITNIHGFIEYVNPKFTEITGYGFDEIIGKSPRVLESENISDEESSLFLKAFAKGDTWYGEYRNKKKDGSLVWVSSIISPVENLSGNITHFLVVQEDISDKKKAEFELLSAKQKAEESDKLKTIILANMQHEFRTPLIGIQGFAQILMEDAVDTEQSEMLKNILVSGNRLLNTLNSVLALSKFESDGISLRLKVHNISEEIRSITHNFETAAKEKNIEFVLDAEQDVNALYDQDVLTNALNNLLDNAIKFTKEGSVSVKVSKLEKEGQLWANIKVIDTGIGIKEKDHELIYIPFRQASEGYSRNYEGAGLGLTLAKRMIESMNGKITLESKPSAGSTFTIWLPC